MTARTAGDEAGGGVGKRGTIRKAYYVCHACVRAIRAVLNDSNPKRVKGVVLPAVIDGIRVDARDRIEPIFRVPAVRIESGFMELAGLEPATSWVRSRRSPN